MKRRFNYCPNMVQHTTNQRSIVLHRAIDILELLGHAEGFLSLSEIASKVDAPKATIHRLVSGLEERGYLTKDPTDHRYGIGVQCYELGSRWVQGVDLRKMAAAGLEQLNTATRETVHLAIYDRGQVVYIEKLESCHPVVCKSYVGLRAPSTCVATGRALLAFQSIKEIERLLSEPIPAFTDKTIRDPDKLNAMLCDVRANGYAVNRGSYREGVGGVAAPIRDHSGSVVASIGCCLPEYRMDEGNFLFLKDKTVEAAGVISSGLGETVANIQSGTKSES